MEKGHLLITGGAGYIGSLLTGVLLRRGYRVTVVDQLLFGAESLLAYHGHPRFTLVQADVVEPRALLQAVRRQPPVQAVIHLAAIVGFPACQAVGRTVAWRYNVEAVRRAFEQANTLGAQRFLFASTYSVYGYAEKGHPVREDSPLHPQSLYAETKVAAEEFLLGQTDAPAAPVIFRLATLYGLSPRTRFDLIINQFVLEAFTRRKLLIYQRGYSRSFVHIRDAVEGLLLGLTAPEEKVRGQVFNLGTEQGNLTKDQIVALILQRIPETVVEYKDLTFGGDMRDVTAAFDKIQRVLGFKARRDVVGGIREVHRALKEGWFKNPWDERYRNAQFIVQ
ncbi:MAG TPA: NAD(P)-dependent oxidoreductase [Anaerolineae bacterium]|nr:NAD(P)-dependent oxidoreductase [Anaerolineae bacterium]